MGRKTTSAQEFVRRSGAALVLGTEPFLFMGANSYYLPFAAAYGQTAAVDEVFSTARGLGLSVLRTWAFYDSPDSSDSAVFQLRPGEYNEVGLRGLDCVIASAKAAGIRLILPLVNSWDDYGGMNQYVRWRAAWLGSQPGAAKRYSGDEMTSVVNNGEGERYRVALSSSAGHDDFFTDTIIRSWYKQYVAMLFQRVNTVTGVAYRDEPAILGWELANEPRSSDASGKIGRSLPLKPP